jgi:hypothetical protein
MGRRSAIGLIGGLAALAAAVAWLLPPIAQDPAYHRLADSRPWLGIPNALNVLSNAGFLLVGALVTVRGEGYRLRVETAAGGDDSTFVSDRPTPTSASTARSPVVRWSR